MTTSSSSINSDKELTINIFELGNSSINFFCFSSSDNCLKLSNFIILSTKYLMPLGLSNLFLNKIDQNVP